MAWSRSRVLFRLLLPCLPVVLVGCSDDGEPQGNTAADDGTGDAGDTAADPTITTTQSTSITNGDDDDDDDDGTATDQGVTADDGTTAADDGASLDDTGHGTDGTAGTDDGVVTGTGSDERGTEDPGSTGDSNGTDGTTAGGESPIGAECTDDADCSSGVCWDFSDYDPFCFGAICSSECEEDEDCVDVATDAGSIAPENAYCGEDGRCDLVGTGLGAFACASR